MSTNQKSTVEGAKKKITIRDIMTIAAMMVLTLIVSGVTGPLTLPVPFLYLYVCAGLQMFLCATFYLVVANRLNKHGIFLVWGVVYGLILGLSGYLFLLPYFVGVAAICEAAMIGKNTYRSPLRNTIGWSIWGLGMIIGNAVPIWAAWDSYVAQASASGFSQEVFDMQINMLSDPWHMILACAITLALAVLGCLFGNRILRRHFKKAGIVG
jgi:energy-coupling factor transport system substrate-specific component